MKALRGRPRGSTAFTSNPKAPRLTEPLPQGSQEVIPATQPPQSAQEPPKQPPTPEGSSIIVATQPTRGRSGNRGRGRGGRGSRGGGTVRPSIHRERSNWEGVELEGSQMTAIGGGQAIPTPSSGADNVVNSGKARGGSRTASGSRKASTTAGITKNKRGRGGRNARSGQSGDGATA